MQSSDTQSGGENSSFFNNIAGGFYYIFLLGPLTLSIILLYSASHAGTATVESTGIMQLIEKNIETPLIADITVTNSFTNCPTDYSAMYLGEWPGTSTGCHTHALLTGDSITTSACGKGDSKHTISSVSAIKFTNFDGNVFCAKYLHPKTDFLYEYTCSYGYISCGSYLCVRESLSCPVVDVTYFNSRPIEPSPDEKVIKLNGISGFLVLKKGSSSSPLLDLFVEFNGEPCLSKTQHPVKKTGEYYPLLEQKPQGCGHFGAFPSTHLLTTKSEEAFYKDNGIPVDTRLKLYSKYLEGGIAGLYARPRIGVQYDDFCLQLDPIVFENASEGITNAVFAASMGGGILLIAGLGIFFCAGFVPMVNDKRLFFSLDTLGQSYPLRASAMMLGVVIHNIVMVVVIRNNVNQLQGHEEYLQKVAKRSCFSNPMINQGAREFLAAPEIAAGLYHLAITALVVDLSLCVLVIAFTLLSPKRSNLVAFFQGKTIKID